jgi:hypothetical protein
MVMVGGKIFKNERHSCSDQSSAEAGDRRPLRLFKESDDDGVSLWSWPGIGIFFGSITLTFIMTPLFVFMSILEFKYIEEPELKKRFGNVYTEYKEKTPIIIPRIHRK